MTGPRSASPLASSGADWTGADIGGLHDLAAARLSDLYAVFTVGREPAARQVAGDPAGSIAGVAAADVAQAGLGDQAADPAGGDAGHLWDSVL